MLSKFYCDKETQITQAWHRHNPVTKSRAEKEFFCKPSKLQLPWDIVVIKENMH